jgi:hypothetical protein
MRPSNSPDTLLIDKSIYKHYLTHRVVDSSCNLHKLYKIERQQKITCIFNTSFLDSKVLCGRL